MSFIIKGKTNFKFILIVILLTIIVSVVIFYYLWLFAKEIETFRASSIDLLTKRNIHEGTEKNNDEKLVKSLQIVEIKERTSTSKITLDFKDINTASKGDILGDIILEKYNEKIILVKNVKLMTEPNLAYFEVRSANIPDIFYIEIGEMGMIGQVFSSYYVNSISNEVVSIKYYAGEGNYKGFEINKSGLPSLNISLETIDACGPSPDEHCYSLESPKTIEGVKARTIDILLNNQPTNLLNEVIETECMEQICPNGTKIIYPVFPSIDPEWITADFTKLYFFLYAPG